MGGRDKRNCQKLARQLAKHVSSKQERACLKQGKRRGSKHEVVLWSPHEVMPWHMSTCIHTYKHTSHTSSGLWCSSMYYHRNHSQENFLVPSFSPYLSSNGPIWTIYGLTSHYRWKTPHLTSHHVRWKCRCTENVTYRPPLGHACGTHMKRLDLSPRPRYFIMSVKNTLK